MKDCYLCNPNANSVIQNKSSYNIEMKMCNRKGYWDRLSHIDNNHVNEILEKKSVVTSSLTYWEMQVVFEIVVLEY